MSDLMKTTLSTVLSFSLRAACVAWLLGLSQPTEAQAAAPAWWQQRGVLDANQSTNDYAAVNIGQLKHIAKQAMLELEAKLPGGAGTTIQQMVTSWSTVTPDRNDFAAVNVGQLKAVAKPFYDRLTASGYNLPLPWSSNTTDRDDFAMANVGQLKAVFSFLIIPVDPNDSDSDGMPNTWEVLHNFNPEDSANAGSTPYHSLTDPDRDGLPNLQEYLHGTNPHMEDTDGDLMMDGWEVANGMNPLLADDPAADPDLDGMSNWQELLAGTSPLVAQGNVQSGLRWIPLVWTVLSNTSVNLQGNSGTKLTNITPANASDSGSAQSPLALLRDGAVRFLQAKAGKAAMITLEHIQVDSAESASLEISAEGILTLRYGPQAQTFNLMTSSNDVRQGYAGHLFCIERSNHQLIFSVDDVVVWSVPINASRYGISVTLGASGSELALCQAAGLELDTDSDGMADTWETQFGSDMLPGADNDSDGLTNLQEFLLGTSPNSNNSDNEGIPDSALADQADTDGDGMPSGVEQHLGLSDSNPEDAWGDLDHDGIPNLTEFLHHSNPNGSNDAMDSDGDGMSDVFENFYWPYEGTYQAKNDFYNATSDDDFDGVLNYEEAKLALDPINPATRSPQIQDRDLLIKIIGPISPRLSFTDWDLDGLPDWHEHWINQSILALSPPPPAASIEPPHNLRIASNHLDTDQDSLNDLQEYTAGTKTDPLNADTDGDGLNDSIDPLPGSVEFPMFTLPPPASSYYSAYELYLRKYGLAVDHLYEVGNPGIAKLHNDGLGWFASSAGPWWSAVGYDYNSGVNPTFHVDKYAAVQEMVEATNRNFTSRESDSRWRKDIPSSHGTAMLGPFIFPDNVLAAAAIPDLEWWYYRHDMMVYFIHPYFADRFQNKKLSNIGVMVSGSVHRDIDAPVLYQNTLRIKPGPSFELGTRLNNSFSLAAPSPATVTPIEQNCRSIANWVAPIEEAPDFIVLNNGRVSAFHGLAPGVGIPSPFVGSYLANGNWVLLKPSVILRQTGPGLIKMYAIKNKGMPDEQTWEIPLSDSSNSLDLYSLLYGSNPTIPFGPNVSYWMEALQPGKVSLSFIIERDQYRSETTKEVTIAPLEVDYISRNPTTGSLENLGGLIPESRPSPNVDIQIGNTQITQTGELQFTLSASVSDSLAGLLENSGPQVVNILFDGEVLESVLLSFNDGGTTQIWQPYTNQTNFTRTITIPKIRAGSHVVRVHTSPNTANEVGWDQATIIVRKFAIPFDGQSLPATDQPPSAYPNYIPVSVTFSGQLSNVNSDSISLTHGGNAAVILSEPDSLPSELAFSGESTALRAILELDTAPILDTTQVDSIQATAEINLVSGAKVRLSGYWSETGTNTNVFTPTLFRYLSDSNPVGKLIVDSVQHTTRQHPSSLTPFVVRIRVPNSIADLLIQPDGPLSFEVGGRRVSTVKDNAFDLGSINSDGMASLFLAKDNKPQVFAVVEENQGDLLPWGVFQASSFSLALKYQDGDSVLFSESSIIEDDDPTSDILLNTVPSSVAPATQTNNTLSGILPNAGSAASNQAYDLPQVMRWLAVLDEFGDGKLINLLTFYQSLGVAEFRVEVTDLWDATDWDGYHIKNTDQRHENAALPCIIQIDDDFPSAIHAAQALLHAIAEVRTTVWRSNFMNTPDPIADYNAMFGRMGVALDNVATAGQIGLGLLNEGADWVLTIPEIAGNIRDGKHKQAAIMSAAMVIPFVSGVVVKKGIGLKIRGATGELIELPGEVLDAFAAARAVAKNADSAAASRLEAMKVLGPLLQSGQISRDLMESLIERGFFFVSKSSSYYHLQKALGTNGFPNLRAHHDLPIDKTLQNKFLLAGLDPNDPSFGRAVDKATHAAWHNGKDVAHGGTFNQVWREFFDENQNATAQQILAHLQKIRSGHIFQVTLKNGTEKLISFAP